MTPDKGVTPTGKKPTMDKENGKWTIETLEGEEEELMELEDKGFLDGQKPGSHLEEQNLDKAKEPGK